MSEVIKQLGNFLYRQPDATWRLAAVRLNVAAVVGVTVVKLPPGAFFDEHRDTVGRLVEPAARDRLLTAEAYEWLRRSTLVSVAVWAVTGSPLWGIIAAGQYARLSEHLVAFFPKRWSYNSHLAIFMLVAGSCDSSGRLAWRPGGGAATGDPQVHSLAVASMQAYVGGLYLQSAVSKLKYGGLSWFSSGRTLRLSTAVMGTKLGHRLYRRPVAFRALSLATLGVETLFLPCLLAGRPDRRTLALSALAFHVGAASLLRISFWQLWALYPALFLIPSPAEARRLWQGLGERI